MANGPKGVSPPVQGSAQARPNTPAGQRYPRNRHHRVGNARPQERKTPANRHGSLFETHDDHDETIAALMRRTSD